MIKLENIEIMGWESAIRGMRNPMNSWTKSDTQYCRLWDDKNMNYQSKINIGPNDLDLMKKLVKAGTDHRKFMRMITVHVDITAPLYWWKEFDTYKVGTVANSCSTMHTITNRMFRVDDFSCEHLSVTESIPGRDYSPTGMLLAIINDLNTFRELYIKTHDKKYWWQIIQTLPSSYNQKRTVMMSYEVLANIYKSRKNHKLDEWVNLCKEIEDLPYSFLITGQDPEIDNEG